ncbi:Aste57867_8194 [Aphanomyces stellatus]|uniref:Aste57867_8194 protein n=1 Tax=Aphanomyces stellatus TaxID=120398 RepID=A0A485KJQ0_9STRA|nr:hypothetical protein As57867_008163 [Aphanomyces stellatus]VFT85082.1 Aste57867_8194 [Aphanomyces stellatus]
MDAPIFPACFPQHTNVTAVEIDCDRVFVVEDASATTAQICADADTPFAWQAGSFDAVGVVDGENVLRLTCRTNDDVGAHYLVNLFVPSRSLRRITFVSSGTLVVYPRTLVDSMAASISITNTDAGTIFIQDQALHMHDLALEATGTGSIQWDVASTVVMDAIGLRTTSAGNVTLLSRQVLTAATLSATTTTSGNIAATSANLTVASHVATSLSGSGTITYTGHGACGNHSITQMGPGNAYTSAMQCANTSVLATSTGDVYVASSHALDVTQLGAGTVFLVSSKEKGQAPLQVSGTVSTVVDELTTTTPPLLVAIPPHVLQGSPHHATSSRHRHRNPPVEYTIQGSITSLLIDCDRTFVRAQDNDMTTTKIIATPDAKAPANVESMLLHSVEVVDGDTLLTVWCQHTPYVENLYVVDIVVPAQSIQYVAFRGRQHLVLYPHTLHTSSPRSTNVSLAITNEDRGNIFIQDSAVDAVHSLALRANGAGSIQWNVPRTVVADTIELRAGDAGSVILFATSQLSTEALTASTHGHGVVFVQSTNLTVATSMHTDIAGTGGIAYTTHGTCGDHIINQMGRGHVYASAITCAKTSVLAASSGDVFVATANALDVNQMGSGTVFVQQSTPPPHVSGAFQMDNRLTMPNLALAQLPPHDDVVDDSLEHGADPLDIDVAWRQHAMVGLALAMLGLFLVCRHGWRRWNQQRPRWHQLLPNAPTSPTNDLYDPRTGTINYVETPLVHAMNPRNATTIPRDTTYGSSVMTS